MLEKRLFRKNSIESCLAAVAYSTAIFSKEKLCNLFVQITLSPVMFLEDLLL